jgi:hypothetical protein
MVGMVAALLLLGLPWVRSGSVAPEASAPAPAASAQASLDRIVMLAATDSAYRALAIPRSYKTAPSAPNRVLVFHGGLCVRDYGLVDAQSTDETGDGRTHLMQETGTTRHAFVASDAQAAIITETWYDSRVDLTPGQKSTKNDTVTGTTTLTFIDPGHPDGRWRITLEQSRWVKDVLVLPAGRGVALTTFLPRTGPNDFRLLDAAGRESVRVPESSAEAMKMDVSPEGSHVAAEFTLRDDGVTPERGVMVFDVATKTKWMYGWRYGTDAEPLSWSLQAHGILAVKLAEGTRRFDATGRKL